MIASTKTNILYFVLTFTLFLTLPGCGGSLKVAVTPDAYILHDSTILLVNKGSIIGNPEEKISRILKAHGLTPISGQIIADHRTPRLSLSPPPEYVLEFRCDPYSDASQFLVNDFSAALLDLRSGELTAAATFSGRHAIQDVFEDFTRQLLSDPQSRSGKPEQLLVMPLSKYEIDPRVPQWELSKQTHFDPIRIQHVHTIAALIEEYYKYRGIYPLADRPLPVDVPIAREVIKYPFPVIEPGELEKELSKVLKKEISLPRDPQKLMAWGFRLYQYHVDDIGYTVSAHLFYERSDTRRIRDFVHKYQVGSFEDRDAGIRRFTPVPISLPESQPD